MTTQQRILAFAKKHSQIDQSYIVPFFFTKENKKAGQTWEDKGVTSEFIQTQRDYLGLRKNDIVFSARTGQMFSTKEELESLLKFAVEKMKNFTPATYWGTSGFIYDSLKQKDSFSPYVVLKEKALCRCIYTKYDEELEVLELSIIEMNSRFKPSASKEENRKEWVKNDKYPTLYFIKDNITPYIIQDGKCIVCTEFAYPSNKVVWSRYPIPDGLYNAQYNYYYKRVYSMTVYTLDKYLGAIDHIWSSEQCINDFEKFAKGKLYGGNGARIKVEYLGNAIREYFKRQLALEKQKAKNKNKSQTCKKGSITGIINAQNALIKDDISNLCKNHAPILGNRYYERINDLWYIEQLPDYTVIRYIARTPNNESDENYRIFISNNPNDYKVLFAKKIDSTTWAPSQERNLCNVYGSKGRLVNPQIIVEHPRFKYYNSIIFNIQSNVPNEKIVEVLVGLSSSPIVELIWKSGCQTLAKKVLERFAYIQSKTGREKFLENIFGSINISKKTLQGKLGCSLYQLNMAEREWSMSDNKMDLIRAIKTMLNTNDISYLDSDTFDNYMYILELFGTGHFSYSYAVERMFVPVLGEDRNKIIRLYLKMAKLDDKNNLSMTPVLKFAQFITDSVDLMKSVPAERLHLFNIYDVNSVSEVIRFHNNLVEEVNAFRFEASRQRKIYEENERKETMQKIDKKRKDKFEYSDGEFLIRLPASETEIRDEGILLDHCVSGYAPRHARGETTILFLRRVRDPDIPVLTIEVGNSMKVRQAHGKHNGWLQCICPDATKFFMRWLRDKEIECDKEIYLLTANGYSAYGEMVEEPVI